MCRRGEFITSFCGIFVFSGLGKGGAGSYEGYRIDGNAEGEGNQGDVDVD